MKQDVIATERSTLLRDGQRSIVADEAVRSPGASEGPLRVLSAIVFVALTVLIEIVVRVGLISDFFVPTPTSVVSALGTMLSDSRFWGHVQVTVIEILLGFVVAFIAALLLGAVVAVSRPVEVIVYPYITLFQAVPKIAIAPLVVLYLGFGLGSKIVLAALVAFFPMFVNVIEGIRTVDDRMLDYFKLQQASTLETFTRLRVPNALPFIMSGARVGMVFAILGAVVGEFVGATQGLGYYLIQQKAVLNTPGIFAILVILMTFGLTVHVVFTVLERKLLFWSRVKEGR